jgi:hypothetical protein
VQEPQFSPFESDTLTPAERQALKRARGRRFRALLVCVGTGMLTLFAAGCPEPADLQDPGSFPLPPGASGSGTTGGSTSTAGTSSGAECESACFKTIVGSTCKSCHGKLLKIAGKLDFENDGVTGRLKNQPAEHLAVTPGATCPSGDKLIDTTTPANSWLLKKIKNEQGDCGTIMPSTPPPLTADQIKCFEDFVACVSGAAPAGTGGTASGTAGTATGGTGGT